MPGNCLRKNSCEADNNHSVRETGWELAKGKLCGAASDSPFDVECAPVRRAHVAISRWGELSGSVRALQYEGAESPAGISMQCNVEQEPVGLDDVEVRLPERREGKGDPVIDDRGIERRR
jgi:hypothetical protein